jgi:hypothetical protein
MDAYIPPGDDAAGLVHHRVAGQQVQAVVGLDQAAVDQVVTGGGGEVVVGFEGADVVEVLAVDKDMAGAGGDGLPGSCRKRYYPLTSGRRCQRPGLATRLSKGAPAPTSCQRRFFVPAMTCYGGCARETFESAGFLCPGSPTCVQLPPCSFGDDLW